MIPPLKTCTSKPRRRSRPTASSRPGLLQPIRAAMLSMLVQAVPFAGVTVKHQPRPISTLDSPTMPASTKRVQHGEAVGRLAASGLSLRLRGVALVPAGRAVAAWCMRRQHGAAFEDRRSVGGIHAKSRNSSKPWKPSASSAAGGCSVPCTPQGRLQLARRFPPPFRFAGPRQPRIVGSGGRIATQGLSLRCAAPSGGEVTVPYPSSSGTRINASSAPNSNSDDSRKLASVNASPE